MGAAHQSQPVSRKPAANGPFFGPEFVTFCRLTRYPQRQSLHNHAQNNGELRSIQKRGRAGVQQGRKGTTNPRERIEIQTVTPIRDSVVPAGGG